MDALHENIAQYTHSGSKPCRQAGAGEFPIGISFEYRANTTKASGAPIDIVFPTEGLGWDLEASGDHEGHQEARRREEARRLGLDAATRWSSTPRTSPIVAMPGIAKPLPNVPADYEKRLVKNDFALGGEEPRPDPRRVEQALRREGRAEVAARTTARPVRAGRGCRLAVLPMRVRLTGRRARWGRTPESTTSRTCGSTGITKSFGRFQALHGIDLAIERGELVTFLGPSGCGKTTLLRIIAGLETQDAGTIVQDGRDISRLPAIRRDYGIVFQSYALFPNLTIDANVAYGLVNRRKGRDEIERRVAELLKLVGLPDSGGQVPGTALRRPAAADRARARARDGARAAAARRAAVGARRARARAAARRDPRAAAAARRDDDPGHARPGGSAVDGRPHRRDERRAHRAGRHAARRSTRRRPRRSSPTSSARSTCSPAVAEGAGRVPRRRA